MGDDDGRQSLSREFSSRRTAFMTEVTVWAAVHGYTEFALFGEVSLDEGDPNFATWDHVFDNLNLKASS